MLPNERQVAGLRCSDVLEELADYLDGVLSPDLRARMEEHVRGCDICERFGGEYAAAVAALKRELGEPPPVPTAVSERLRERLRKETLSGDA
jgi:anti-sigma factor RsiW